MHRADRGVVGLHEGVAGAGNVQRRVVQEDAQQGAGQGGLAGAKGTLQEDGIARAEVGGDAGGEGFGGGEVGKVEGERHGITVA